MPDNTPKTAQEILEEINNLLAECIKTSAEIEENIKQIREDYERSK